MRCKARGHPAQWRTAATAAVAATTAAADHLCVSAGGHGGHVMAVRVTKPRMHKKPILVKSSDADRTGNLLYGKFGTDK